MRSEPYLGDTLLMGATYKEEVPEVRQMYAVKLKFPTLFVMFDFRVDQRGFEWWDYCPQSPSWRMATRVRRQSARTQGIGYPRGVADPVWRSTLQQPNDISQSHYHSHLIAICSLMVSVASCVNGRALSSHSMGCAPLRRAPTLRPRSIRSRAHANIACHYLVRGWALAVGGSGGL